jgi:hypothetical protein
VHSWRVTARDTAQFNESVHLITTGERFLFTRKEEKGEVIPRWGSARKVWRRASALPRLRNEDEGGTGERRRNRRASRASRDASCARREEETPGELSLQLREVVRARPDYRETQRTTSERRSGRQSKVESH